VAAVETPGGLRQCEAGAGAVNGLPLLLRHLDGLQDPALVDQPLLRRRHIATLGDVQRRRCGGRSPLPSPPIVSLALGLIRPDSAVCVRGGGLRCVCDASPSTLGAM
jgi:hypothetical protein